MALTIPYTVISGQRWDQISQAAYGNPYSYKGIIEANPQVPVSTRIPGGTILKIPIIPANSITTDAESLPPWKR